MPLQLPLLLFSLLLFFLIVRDLGVCFDSTSLRGKCCTFSACQSGNVVNVVPALCRAQLAFRVRALGGVGS